MKNTTFRKKALLSSVAMLLVALVALGSATFAWFTANPNVDADGLKMTTSAEAGLVGISSTELTVYGHTAPGQAEAAQWDHNIVLNAKKDTDGKPVANTDLVSLSPVSGLGMTKYSIAAADDGQYNADTNESVVEDSSFYKETLYFKSTDDSALTDVYFEGITMTKRDNAPEIASAVRVELVKSTGDVIGTYGFDAEGNTYLTKTGNYTAALAVDNPETTGVDESKYTCAMGVDKKISVGGCEANGYVTVYLNVYLDGEDSTCFSRNAVNAGELLKSLHLDFTTTA